MTHITQKYRSAFTLIELLVVIALIVVLATLVVAVANSSIVDSYKISSSSDRLSGWLIQAKTRALRDRTPIGIRLIPNTDNPNFCSKAELIELPEVYSPVQESDPNILNPNAPSIEIRYAEVTVAPNQFLVQDSGPNDPIAGIFLNWPTNSPTQYPLINLANDLAIGDLIRLPKYNSSHKITRIESVSPTIPNTVRYKLTSTISPVTLAAGALYPPAPFPVFLRNYTTVAPLPAVAAPTFYYPTGYPPLGGANFDQTNHFGIYRSPRPIIGEPLLQLPANMVIDIRPHTNSGGSLAAVFNAGDTMETSINIRQAGSSNLDIIFTPQGNLLNKNEIVSLWLRDARNGNGDAPLLVTAVNPAGSTSPTTLQINKDRLSTTGEHVLVSIFPKTGVIVSNPVFTPDPSGNYNAATDGSTPQAPHNFAKRATNTGL